VGAGLSGLTAAYRLEQAGSDAVVLEARGRIGGRAWRLDVGGLPFDAGCEAFDDGDERLRALAAEVGVESWHTHRWGGDLDEPPPALCALADEIAALAARIDPAHPEDVEGAGRLDAQTLGGRLAELGASSDELAEAETRYAVASSGVPVGEMSLLAYAAKVAAGAARTGLTLRLRGGPIALADALAAELDVRLGAEVVGIEEEGLRLRDGARLPAARVVLAVPLTVQQAIRCDRPLPEHRRLALARARYGHVVKAALGLDDVDVHSLPRLTANGLLYQPDPRVPLLALFAGADAAHRARELASVASVDWTGERWSAGSYVIFGPGDLTTWGRRLAEPHGRIHFAGSEASALPSYVEGAVRAGERAADEVLAAG
jgi:monoamine oxidase